MSQLRRVAIIGGNRIPFARSNGPYAAASNQAMLTAALEGLIERYNLHGQRIGEVVAGAVLKLSRDMNLTRECVLGSRLSPATPAYDIQQACGTGLEAALLVANKIAIGQIDCGIAGGVDTTSDAPISVSEGLLMAPVYAVPRLLARNGLTLQDFDYYEIHEAFAAQVLCTLKAWEDPEYCKTRLGLDAPLGSIDRSRLNVKGSSLAAGHPFAATGGRIVANLAKLLDVAGQGRGLISICAAGGQGVTAIIER